MKKFGLIPMKLQFFASPEGGNGGTEPPVQQQQQPNEPAQSPAIDYGKIQQMLDGTLKAKEDTALKAYFKQQGLSQQEAEQAIADFKQQKAANTPDVAGLQNQVAQAQAVAQQAQIKAAATIAAVNLGIDSKRIPYLLQMTDLSQVMSENGKINEEAITTAINTVLEAIPEFKPQAGEKIGFTQVGTGGNPAQHPQQTQTTKPQVPVKRWNRFN